MLVVHSSQAAIVLLIEELAPAPGPFQDINGGPNSANEAGEASYQRDYHPF
jgi:hypothetical protein